MLFGLLPDCGAQDCDYPGIIRIEFSDENGPVWVDLCPGCAVEIRKLIGEVKQVQEEKRLRIEQEEREEIHG